MKNRKKIFLYIFCLMSYQLYACQGWESYKKRSIKSIMFWGKRIGLTEKESILLSDEEIKIKFDRNKYEIDRFLNFRKEPVILCIINEIRAQGRQKKKSSKESISERSE